MFFWRKIGKILRGKATPFQIIAASVLGAMIGFVPGWREGGGLLVTLILLLVILNANLVVALVVAAGSKLLSLALMPVSFQIGGLLLDGPTQPLFRAAINAPVLALFGLEYYVTTGGMVLGLAAGLVVGVLLVAAVRAFRRRMARLHKEKQKFHQFASKLWVRLLAWVFIGGRVSKKSYEELDRKRVGLPVRPAGVVLAVLVAAGLWFLQGVLASPILKDAIEDTLARANGATVDIEDVELDLRTQRIRLVGLAMADPNALETDIFRASELTGDVAAKDLLRKRIALDELVAADASSGMQREMPGELVTRQEVPPPEPGEGKTIEEWLETARVWRERLRQVERWIEELPQRTPKEEKETLRDRLERAAGQYRAVRATHLVEGAPTIRIALLRAEGVNVARLPDDPVDVRGENLSSQPWLDERTPRIVVRSRSGRLDTDVVLGGAASVGGENTLRFSLLDVPTGWIERQFKGSSPVRGGSFDVQLDGRLAARDLALPLSVTFREAQVGIPGAGEVDTGAGMPIVLDVRGRLSNPRVALNAEQLQRALVDAGKAEAARRLGEEKGKLLDKAREELDGKLGGELEGKLGEEAEKVLDGGLKNILGGGGRKRDGGG